MAQKQQKYYTLRDAHIHNHAFPTSLAKLEWGFVSLQSAALGIHPCRQPDFQNHMAAYRHPEPFPYSQQSCRYVQVELPNPVFARVYFRFFKNSTDCFMRNAINIMKLY